MAVIETEALTKRYGDLEALVDLTVQVSTGVTGLVGANGAGKSTLLKILLGLLQPTSGSAAVLGHDIRRDGSSIRAVVGYMPEHDCLPPDVRAIDFIVHMGRVSGLPPAAARERAADVLRHVGLAEERYRLMGAYSTGMKQRAKLAQALVHDPRLVLLDEPTNGLDPEAREDMIALVARIGRDFGIPVLVTSHLLGELERVSDHVIVLDGGRLLRSQRTTELTQDTGVLLVEVLGSALEQRRVGEALAAAGLPCRPRQQLIEIDLRSTARGAAPHDVIRDTACDLGVGLVRLQPEHGRIQDVFQPEGRSGG
ncbi:MAG TPA: ABC transporter ATP-binding protein [Ornithinimicrobium sp.]|uniref:ABC transporter ATP-binding protein n=1 Tax=Ornithinimicrobium sp. TaxID=1977084 RepID=UPI002B48A042|nr:ABC transporter ATP-binding protein [Ornithinimicrobium sp.]HKJ11315.1 ABC transporter ATP-binding protein [Ornithinimicrobium sp.]